MNKKGFVFVETIIVITVLITALLLIYAGFVSVLNNEKVHSYYDDPVYLYRSIYLKSFLEKNNTSVLFNGVDENGIIRFNCNYEGLIEDYDNVSLNTNAFCETLLSAINVDSVFLTQYNINDYKNCPNFYSKDNSLVPSEMCLKLENLMDYPTYDYFRTLRSYSDSNNLISGYRMILVYRNLLNDVEECNPNDVVCKENEYYENYYTSLKLQDAHTENKFKNVRVNVVHGSTSINSVNTVVGRDLTFAITPATNYKTDHAQVSCTNGQTGVVSGSNFVINNVTNDTVCTVTLMPKCSVADNTSWNFDYSGNSQTFTAACRGTYQIELWGAQGGGAGGKGGYTTGEISIDANQKFYLFIGGTNGYNGGAAGGVYPYDNAGGGATDVRLLNDISNLNSRIMVAGGGGGSIINGTYKAAGGNAGGRNGGKGKVTFFDNGCGESVAVCQECDTTVNGEVTCTTGTSCGCLSHDASGATQISGGSGAHYLKYKSGTTYILSNASDGRFGVGGTPGGGGGFYGGGGGLIAGNAYVGGGGGSSCVNGSLDVIDNYYDCSSNNYKFNNITYTAGNNTGNGHATITLLESF